MKKFFLVLLGLAIGYFIGFSDARRYKHNVLERMVSRAGGSARGKYNSNIDQKLEQSLR